ncbi:MAG TPA: hypothetical protein VIE39_02950, partial [Thermoanaerobaculia bacterium]
WQPLGAKGPIEADTTYCALAMKKLTELTPFIKNGGSVLLMMAPCAGERCDSPKGRITKLILDLPDPLITHLVIDSRAAAQIVQELRPKEPRA